MWFLKVVLLVWYSDTKIILKMMKLIFSLKTWLWKLDMVNFWLRSIKLSYKIWKKSLRKLIWMQKSIEFHLPHYEIPQLSSHYCLFSFSPNTEMFIMKRFLTGFGWRLQLHSGQNLTLSSSITYRWRCGGWWRYVIESSRCGRGRIIPRIIPKKTWGFLFPVLFLVASYVMSCFFKT